MSREGRRGNVPRSATTLIGRDQALPEITALLRSHQLVTLSGVGGVGKTRLALAAAAELDDRFPDGVWLVELAPVGEPDAVPDAIADALGISRGAVKSHASRGASALRVSLADYLEDRS